MKTIVLALALMASLAAMAAAEICTGVVLNKDNSQPLPAATISVDGTSLRVKADDNGRFELADVVLPATVTVSHVGFATRRSVPLTLGGVNEIVLEPSLSVLNSIVVTANRYEKEAYKVSQPITALNADQIETKGYPIVSDIIREFPGVDMNDAGPFRSRPVIRGLYGTRILVLVDGERLNDQRDVSDFAGVSMSLVDPSEIQRVEVVNGPSSVLYGSDAMAGVINIITRKEQFNGSIKPFVRYSGRYSTADEQHSNRVDLGFESKRYAASFGVQYREALKDFKPPKGWQSDDKRYDVFRPEFYDSLNEARGTSFSRDRLTNSRARVNNYSAGFAFKYSDKQRLDADWGAFRGRDIGYPGVPNANTPFLFLYPSHDRDHFSLTYTGTSLTKRMARLEARLYYDRISKVFLTDFLDAVRVTFGPSGVNPLTSMNRTEITKVGFNLQELHQLSDKATLTFGADSWTEQIEGNVNSTTEYTGPAFGLPPGVSRDSTTTGSSVPDNRWYSLGLYSSGEMTLNRWQLTAGTRLDNFWVRTKSTPGYIDFDNTGKLLPTENQTYSALTGSLGLVYPIGRGVNGVANVGTAYRVPNVVERFYYGSASNRQTRPNPDIKPERSVTIDAGFKGVHPRLSYSLIGFWSDYNDFTQLRNFDSLPPAHPGGGYTRLWRYENVQDVTIYGLEAVIEGQLEMGLYSNLTVSYQHGQNKTDNQPLFVSPLKMVVTGGYRHKAHGLFGELTLRTAGDQNRVPNVTALDDIATRGFAILSATAGVNVYRDVRLAITGNNLTNEVYSEPFNGRNPDNPIPESGRNLIVTVNSSF
jgi:outer membrane receptor protein involved in Fe transport